MSFRWATAPEGGSGDPQALECQNDNSLPVFILSFSKRTPLLTHLSGEQGCKGRLYSLNSYESGVAMWLSSGRWDESRVMNTKLCAIFSEKKLFTLFWNAALRWPSFNQQNKDRGWLRKQKEPGPSMTSNKQSPISYALPPSGQRAVNPLSSPTSLCSKSRPQPRTLVPCYPAP